MINSGCHDKEEKSTGGSKVENCWGQVYKRLDWPDHSSSSSFCLDWSTELLCFMHAKRRRHWTWCRGGLGPALWLAWQLHTSSPKKRLRLDLWTKRDLILRFSLQKQRQLLFSSSLFWHWAPIPYSCVNGPALSIRNLIPQLMGMKSTKVKDVKLLSLQMGDL